jgi:hypothetical protein
MGTDMKAATVDLVWKGVIIFWAVCIVLVFWPKKENPPLHQHGDKLGTVQLAGAMEGEALTVTIRYLVTNGEPHFVIYYATPNHAHPIVFLPAKKWEYAEWMTLRKRK